MKSEIKRVSRGQGGSGENRDSAKRFLRWEGDAQRRVFYELKTSASWPCLKGP